MSLLATHLQERIVNAIAPIIEKMESRYPEKVIATAVEAAATEVIRDEILGNAKVAEKIARAHDRYSEWDYLQTLGSAIDRDSSKEGLAQTIGECAADLLGIDLQRLVQEGR